MECKVDSFPVRQNRRFMHKGLTFFIVSVLLISTRAYDAYSTYLYTPDLSQEVNPLVSILGLTWMPLLIILSLLMLYCLYAFYVSTFEEFDFAPAEKGYSFTEFTTYAYLGHKTHWTAMLIQLPKEFKRFHHYMGQLLTQCLLFAGFVSTLMWIMIQYVPGYLETYHSAQMIYLILGVGSVFLIWNWSRKQYKWYQTRTLA